MKSATPLSITKVLLLGAVLSVGAQGTSYAQSYQNYNANTIQSLSLGSAADYPAIWGSGYLGFNFAHTGQGTWQVQSDGASNGATGLLGGIDGSLHFITIPSVGGPARTLSSTNLMGSSRMMLTNTGALRIGSRFSTAHPDAKLAVEGKIVAQSLYITNPSGWADYVFEPTYVRMPLKEVKAYVTRYKHLPEVPTTADVKQNGVDITAMNVLLLKKVEELTLHLIEATERIEKLEAARVSK